MKKILYITTVSSTINAFLIPHISFLIESGNKVDITSNFNKPIDGKLLNNGVKVFNIPFSRNPLALSNVKAFNELVKIQKDNKYDIVHVHTPVASIYGRLLKLKFRKLKTIYTAHGYHFLKGGSKIGWLLYYPIEKVMAKLTDVIITINKEDYEITKNKLKPKECYLINGVGLDLNKYRKLSDKEIKEKRNELGYKEDDFIVIMIAELNENKNQIQLIKAMELLKNKYPKTKAICVGEGHKLEELQKEVKDRSLDENIKFLGFRTDINELINISNVGTLLSYREGLPRSLMEILVNGKKVIGTDIRGIRDIISSEEAGKLVRIGDYKKTSEYIELYYKDFINKKEVIIPKEIIKSFDVENIKKQIKELI